MIIIASYHVSGLNTVIHNMILYMHIFFFNLLTAHSFGIVLYIYNYTPYGAYSTSRVSHGLITCWHWSKKEQNPVLTTCVTSCPQAVLWTSKPQRHPTGISQVIFVLKDKGKKTMPCQQEQDKGTCSRHLLGRSLEYRSQRHESVSVP